MRSLTLLGVVAGILGSTTFFAVLPAAQERRFTETILWSGDEVPFLGGGGGVTSDGRRFAVADGRGRLYIRETARAGRTDFREFNGGRVENVKFSPSGEHLAIKWWDEEKTVYQLRMIAADASTGNGRILHAGEPQAGQTRPLAWTPDGRSVLAWIGGNANGRLSLISVDDATEKVVKRFAAGAISGADVSPDGRWVAFDFGGLSVIRADGTAERQIVEDPTARMLGWFPTGRRVLFASARSGSAGLWTVEVNEGKASSPRLVQALTARVQVIGFAGDGRFFATLVRGGQNAYLMALDPATGKPRGSVSLLGGDEAGVMRAHATWAPDSRRIAFFRMPPLGPDTFVVRDTESGQSRSYPLSVRNLGRPMWHPGGERVAMHEETGQVGVFELDLRTGATNQILGPTNAYQYAPDGQHIVYRRGRTDALPSAIVQRHLTTGEERVVYLGPGGFDLASDGKSFLIYTRSNASLWTVPVGGQPRLVLGPIKASDHHFGLSHDGRYAFFATRDPWDVWNVSTAGGTPQPLGVNVCCIERISLSPDGKSIAVSGGSATAQVVVWSVPASSISSSIALAKSEKADKRTKTLTSEDAK